MAGEKDYADEDGDESSLLHSEKSNEKQTIPHYSRDLYNRTLLIIAISSSAVALFLIISIIIFVLRLQGEQLTSTGMQYRPYPTLPAAPCGKSPAEAKALGCQWDVYTNAWFTAACYDHYITAMSESEAVYPYFWDANHTQPATMEDLQLEAFKSAEEHRPFHAPWAFHYAHCLHIWRLSAHTLEMISEGKRVTLFQKSADLEHANHCNKLVREFDEHKFDDTKLHPGIADCIGEFSGT